MFFLLLYISECETSKTWPLREFKISRQNRIIKAFRERAPQKSLQPRRVAIFCQ